MPRRTQLYLKANWNGGLNDSVDPGVLPDNDLVIADNVIFATSGSRLKREGIDYFDNIDLPAVTSVTRVGTTVTITFADIGGGEGFGYYDASNNAKSQVLLAVNSDAQF